jgi:hypothetical protein
MATLLSPGVEVTVIDESFFAPVISTSIPYVLLATAQDKLNTSGDLAIGTTAANANTVTPITSRRELVTLFGNPSFIADSAGGVVQGHELNEYGLQTAYSLLGVTNRIYVQRADIDLGQLVGTSVRPTDDPAAGTVWFDLTDTDFGLFEWNESDQTFNKITPIIVNDAADHSGGVPNGDIGNPLDYAIVTAVTTNPLYVKNSSGQWNLVGSDGTWHNTYPTVTSTISNPTLTISDDIVLNGTTVTMTGTSIATAAGDINTAAITGITAAAVDGKLEIYVDETADTNQGRVTIAEGTADDFLTEVGLTAGTFYTITAQLSAHTSVPEWKTTDAVSRPTGSVWAKTTTPNNGADWDISVYDDQTEAFVRKSAPLYLNDAVANNALDTVGGGLNVSSGSIYVRYDTTETTDITFQIYEREVLGETVVTANASSLPITFNSGDSFTISVSEAGSDTFTAAQTITLSGTTSTTFVTDVMNASVPGVTASINSDGQIVFTHILGGTIILVQDDTVGTTTTGTPLTDAGISSALTYVEDGPNDQNGNNIVDDEFILSNWVPATYTASYIEPSVDPADGTYWYFSDVDDVDIMVHDGTNWVGYQTLASDARGYDLTVTSPAGPIVSASEPLLQSDGTALVNGDLWVDTSDLDNYPSLYRRTNAGWTAIDIADATSEDGILFADTRWDTDGTTDVITGDFPLITDLLASSYTDLDAPDAALYPRGTLLWNTRRSGYNVKQYTTDYLTNDNFVGSEPTEQNTWRTVSGLKLDGSPYMGSAAVRNMVVQAMKAGIDASITVREETTTVNLLAAPGYPELIANLANVNTDRKNTSFVVGDSPMTLDNSSLSLSNWASNANLAADNGEDGLVTVNEYLGVYYPAGLTNDLDGNAIVMPSSHMSLRTIIRSDNVSYPWIAPAGIRRGKVDNATSIGYLDANGEFQSIAVGEGLRDVLYTNNVNPISVLPGAGVTVYGQKTRAAAASSLDRVNVARLTANLRFTLDLLARPFIFEPNDKLTRDEFKNEIEKLMNELVAKRAIFDYLVVCDESNNTPARIDRNELWADVAIEPVKAAEFIYIPLRLKNTGEI